MMHVFKSPKMRRHFFVGLSPAEETLIALQGLLGQQKHPETRIMTTKPLNPWYPWRRIDWRRRQRKDQETEIPMGLRGISLNFRNGKEAIEIWESWERENRDKRPDQFRELNNWKRPCCGIWPGCYKAGIPRQRECYSKCIWKGYNLKTWQWKMKWKISELFNIANKLFERDLIWKLKHSMMKFFWKEIKVKTFKWKRVLEIRKNI